MSKNILMRKLRILSRGIRSPPPLHLAKGARGLEDVRVPASPGPRWTARGDCWSPTDWGTGSLGPAGRHAGEGMLRKDDAAGKLSEWRKTRAGRECEGRC